MYAISATLTYCRLALSDPKADAPPNRVPPDTVRFYPLSPTNHVPSANHEGRFTGSVQTISRAQFARKVAALVTDTITIGTVRLVTSLRLLLLNAYVTG